MASSSCPANVSASSKVRSAVSDSSKSSVFSYARPFPDDCHCSNTHNASVLALLVLEKPLMLSLRVNIYRALCIATFHFACFDVLALGRLTPCQGLALFAVTLELIVKHPAQSDLEYLTLYYANYQYSYLWQQGTLYGFDRLFLRELVLLILQALVGSGTWVAYASQVTLMTVRVSSANGFSCMLAVMSS